MKEETIQRMTRLGLVAILIASVGLFGFLIARKFYAVPEEIQATNIESFPSKPKHVRLAEDLVPASQAEVAQIVAVAPEAKAEVVTNNEFVVTIENFQLASPKK